MNLVLDTNIYCDKFIHLSPYILRKNDVLVITLEKLIELKLASGLSATHRMRDLADVQDLIMALNLSLEIKDKLDESVRPEYQRIWEAANMDPRR